jgi:hypothetical protein
VTFWFSNVFFFSKLCGVIYWGKTFMSDCGREILYFASNVFKVCNLNSAFSQILTFRFGGAHTKIGTIQRRLAWPLRKDDTQNREAFLIFLPFFE